MLSSTTISVKVASVVKLVAEEAGEVWTLQRTRSAMTGTEAREREQLQREIAKRAGAERLDLGHLNQHLGYFVRRLQVMIFKDFIQARWRPCDCARRSTPSCS